MPFANFAQGLKEYNPILRNSRFIRILIAGVISTFGSNITYFTLLRKVYDVSGGRVTDLGFLTIVEILPRFLFGPLAGIVADKFSRKKIMIISDILSGLIVLNLIWIQDLRLIYIISFFSAFVNTFRSPAQRAFEPNLVTRDQIVLLNSFKASIESLVRIVGKGLAGATVGFLGVTRAFTFDSITFFFSAALIATIYFVEQHVQKTPDTQTSTTLRHTVKNNLQDLRNSFGIIWNKASIRMVVFINMFVTLAFGMQGTLIYFFLKETMHLGADAEKVWGFLLSALGVGGILGGIIIGSLVKNTENRFRLFLNVLLFDALFFTLFLLNRFLPLSYVLFVGLGVISSANGILLNTIIQEETDDHNRGKVFALLGTLTEPLSLLSITLGTIGAAAIQAVNVLLMSAGFEAVIATTLRFTRTYRENSGQQRSRNRTINRP